MISPLSDTNPLLTIVTVFDVGQQGNSPSGRFLFLLNQEVMHVTDRNSVLEYRLSDDSFARGIRFTGYFATDSHNQLTLAEPFTDISIKLRHANDSEALLIKVSLQVIDIANPTVRGALDPQITNVPSPHV